MQLEKILLVDDDADLRLISRTSLTRLGGWNVVEATSGLEALAMFRDERPDLILLDVMMPGLDGISTLKELRKDELGAEIPVIFITAKAQREEIARYLQLGAVGVIVKPFDPLALADRVRELLEAA